MADGRRAYKTGGDGKGMNLKITRPSSEFGEKPPTQPQKPTLANQTSQEIVYITIRHADGGRDLPGFRCGEYCPPFPGQSPEKPDTM